MDLNQTLRVPFVPGRRCLSADLRSRRHSLCYTNKKYIISADVVFELLQSLTLSKPKTGEHDETVRTADNQQSYDAR